MKLPLAVFFSFQVIVGVTGTAAFAQPNGQLLIYDDSGTHEIVNDLNNAVLRVNHATQLTVRASVSTNLQPDTIPDEPNTQHVAEILGRSRLVIDGGEIWNTDFGWGYTVVTARDGSTIDLLAGIVSGDGGLELNASELNLHEGQVVGSTTGVLLRQGSLARVSGGTIRNGAFTDGGVGVRADDTSQLIFSGGSITGWTDDLYAAAVELHDAAQFLMTGGELMAQPLYAALGLTVLDQGGASFTRISGGKLMLEIPKEGLLATPHQIVRLQDDSRLEVLGGEWMVTKRLGDDLAFNHSRLFDVSGNSSLVIAGGLFQSTNEDELHVDLVVNDLAHVTIVGSDFNLPMFVPIEETAGIITGTLPDGNPLNWEFERNGQATIVLVAEPASTTLFGLGAAWLLSCGFRRKLTRRKGSQPGQSSAIAVRLDVECR
jgi:hypothetical protein